MSLVKQECGGRVRDVVKLAAFHQGNARMAMLLPQNTSRSGADSRLSISMQLSTPGESRQTGAENPREQILAGVLAFVMMGSDAVLAGTLPIGDGAFSAIPLGQSWSGFVDWVAASYAEAPALVLGLAVLAVVPPLALIGWLARSREAKPATISEAQTKLQRVRRPATAEEPRDSVRTGHIPLRMLNAWVEVVAAGEDVSKVSDQRYSLAPALLRIGRETDNDICLDDITVHRYHAAIRRTEDAEFVITDLSSAGGNGVVVNGRTVAEARLASGDMIELGKAKLKFSAAPS